MEKLNRIAEYALSCLAENGADMAHVTASESEKREFNADGSGFTLFRTLFDSDLSLTGYAGGRRGTGAINSFADADVAAAAKDVMTTAATAEPDPAWSESEGSGRIARSIGAMEPDMDRFFFRVREFADDVKAKHPLIAIEELIASYTLTREVYRNSRGAHFETARGLYEISATYTAHDGERVSSMFGMGVGFDDLDQPILSLSTVDRDMADVEKQLDPVPLSGKFTGVAVLTPSCLIDVLGSAAALFAGDNALLSGTGIWKDKLDQRVASECLSIHMAPGDPRILTGDTHTADGREARDYAFIENGVLRAFPISAYAANKTGNAPAPNSDRAFVVRPGEDSLADIISRIDRGIIVARFSGGAPSANGEMSGVAKNSFLIEGGRITSAVTETMMNANIADMLQNIVAISGETVADGNTVLPWVAFDGVTVSGK